MNNFFKVRFDESRMSITLNFINQPKDSEQHYTVRYGPSSPSCQRLPIHTKGHLMNSNSIIIKLNIDPDNTTEICLSITVTNGSRTASLEAVYTIGKHNS